MIRSSVFKVSILCSVWSFSSLTSCSFLGRSRRVSSIESSYEMFSPKISTMLLGIVAVPFSVHIHVLIASSVPPSAGIVAVPCSVHIHVPITSSVPPSTDGLSKHNYAHKDEQCSEKYSSNFNKSLEVRHCLTRTARTVWENPLTAWSFTWGECRVEH